MTSDQRLWVKLGQERTWHSTNVTAFDHETFDIDTLYGYTPETSLQPSAPAADDAGKHGGASTSLVVTMSVLGTVVTGAMIAVLILVVMKYRKGKQLQYRSLDARVDETSSLLPARDVGSYPPIGGDIEQA